MPILPPMKAVQSTSIQRAQNAALAAAVASAVHGNTEPLRNLVIREQSKRDLTAGATFRNYQLYRFHSDSFASGVLNPEGAPYPVETIDGVKRFPKVLDQVFVDKVNGAAVRFGITIRLETKHATIFHLLEQAVQRGEFVYVESADFYGFVTAPNPKLLNGDSDLAVAYRATLAVKSGLLADGSPALPMTGETLREWYSRAVCFLTTADATPEGFISFTSCAAFGNGGRAGSRTPRPKFASADSDTESGEDEATTDAQPIDEESVLARAAEQLEAELDAAVCSVRTAMQAFHATNRAEFPDRPTKQAALKIARDAIATSIAQRHRHDVESRLAAVRARLADLAPVVPSVTLSLTATVKAGATIIHQLSGQQITLLEPTEYRINARSFDGTYIYIDVQGRGFGAFAADCVEGGK